MVKSYECIELFDRPLFTQLSVETPTQDQLPLTSEACYVYIVDSEGQTSTPSESFVALPGQVILSLCGFTVSQMISEQPKGSVDSIIVHLHREQLNNVFEGTKPALWKELESPVTQYLVQKAASELVQHYFDGIAQLFRNKAAITETILKLKLKELVLLLLQTGNSENIRKIVKSLFSERQFTFKELVDAYIYTLTSIKDLALVTNCSVSTFKRRFKEIYKTTPGAYIIDKRVEKVADLLKVSDEPIASIGYTCGFNSPEHLSRAFKKKFGVSPSAYRLSLSIK